jgi:hypothetical protein
VLATASGCRRPQWQNSWAQACADQTHGLTLTRCAEQAFYTPTIQQRLTLYMHFPAQGSAGAVWVPVLLRWANSRLETYGISILDPSGATGLPADVFYKLVEVSHLSHQHPYSTSYHHHRSDLPGLAHAEGTSDC